VNNSVKSAMELMGFRRTIWDSLCFRPKTSHRKYSVSRNLCVFQRKQWWQRIKVPSWQLS